MATRIELLSSPLTAIEFYPSDVLREIAQNVRTILSTVLGSVPLDRTFGINSDMLDAPQPVAQAMLVSEIVTAVERNEPRVRVVGVAWEKPSNETDTQNGVLIPRVTVETRPGVEA